MTQAYKVNSEILVNTAVFDDQLAPRIVALANGGFVVTWTDLSIGQGGAASDHSKAAVKAQVFDAHGKPVGGEILVNSITPDNQFFPTVTALNGGGFVIAWNDASQSIDDDSGFAVRAQVFDSSGMKLDGETLVNTATTNDQASPEIAALSNGGFAVTWADASENDGNALGDNSGYAIKAQVFAANGVKHLGEILVNTIVESDQFSPKIAALPDGRFVVVWEDYSQDPVGVGGRFDDSEWAVKAQVFDADGVRFGAEMLVNTATTDVQWAPQIAVLNDGGFVITWEDSSQGHGGANGDDSGLAVKAQVFKNTGLAFAPVDGEILVNTATANDQTRPQITALGHGGFVVTWSDDSRGAGGAGGDDSGFAVKAQVYDVDGKTIGTEILVNTAWVSGQSVPKVIALAQGGFVITWKDESRGFGGAGGDASGSAVKAQLFADDGARIGKEFLINSATEGDQRLAQSAALKDGGFAVAWEDASKGVGGTGGDSSGLAVKAQLFAIDPGADPAPQPEPPAITLAQVKAAHLNVLGLALPDAAAQLVVDDILKKLYSFDTYIGTLVDKADLSTLPAVIVNALLAGVAPTQAHLPELGAFVRLQYGAYQEAGSSHPALGLYEALGHGYSETARFQSQYGGYDDIGFIAYAYQDVFGRAATQSQITHFDAQLAYFEALYVGAGQSEELASLHAKGAVIGQMIGHMARDEPELHSIDDAAIAFLRAAGHGEAKYGEPLMLI